MPAPSLSLVRWQALNSIERQAVQALQLPPEQVEFAGTIQRAVAHCEDASEIDVAGLAVLQDTRPVGFMVLSRGAKRPGWAPPDSAALTAMQIDVREQGKGIGTATLRLLEPWLVQHWPTSRILALCVDDQNQPGRRAYHAAGFTEYTDPMPGRIGLVRYLSKHMGTEPGEA